MGEWLKSLASQPALRDVFRLLINSGLSDFVYSQDNTEDPLEMPAHAFALDFITWLRETQPDVRPPKLCRFLHGATVWAGLLRILAGRVHPAGVNTSFVTPELVASNLERLLRTIEADLDIAIGRKAVGLCMLVSLPLHSVPAMSRFVLRIPALARESAINRSRFA